MRTFEDALKADPAWKGGFYGNQADVHHGLRLHAQIWAVMGMSQEFYKEEKWREAGFNSADDFLRRFWHAYFLPMDPNNLIWMGSKWRRGDVGQLAGGDLGAALGSIRARTLVVAFSRDLVFPPSDCEAERKMIPGSEFRVIESLWGHFTMFSPTEHAGIDACIRDLLAAEAD